jgi:serine/threonine protein kinase
MSRRNTTAQDPLKDERLGPYEKTNRRYIPIRKAGSGKYGNVWYALKARRRNNKQPLLSQLVALKVPVRHTEELITQEVRKLKQLQSTEGCPTSRFPRCFDSSWDETGKLCRWYTMSSISGFTLYNLRMSTTEPIPEGLVSHITIQLAEAFRWLHSQNPPIIHGDFHAANAMIDPSRQDVPGFPNAMVIDFGTAQNGSEAAIAIERRLYFVMMKELAVANVRHKWCLNTQRERHPDCNHDTEWIDFVSVLRNPTCIQNGIYAMGWQEFWARCVFKAIKRRNAATQETKLTVQRCVDEVMRGVAAMSEEECLEAVEYFDTLKPTKISEVSNESP